MNLGGAIHLNKKICLVIFMVLVLYLYLSSFGNRDEKDFTKKLTKVNLKNLLHMAVFAAENGGKEVKHNINSNKIESKGKTKEGADDRVTTADYRSHCKMQETIKKLYHDIKLISEEFNTNCDNINNLPSEFPSISQEINALNDSWVKGSDITIWIDPLDATQEYTEKMYEFVTTMVCVAVKGKPLIGVIHKPFLKETYWGWVEVSKSSNLQAIERTDDEHIFIVSRSHKGEVKKIINAKLGNIKNKIVEAGGAGYKVLEVIKGNADVYLHTTEIKKWDICAGNALLLSVGGSMTTLKDEFIDYSDTKNVVNTNGLFATSKKNMYLKKLLT